MFVKGKCVFVKDKCVEKGKCVDSGCVEVIVSALVVVVVVVVLWCPGVFSRLMSEPIRPPKRQDGRPFTRVGT